MKNLRLMGAIAAFLLVFFGLMSMVGNVLVGEFYGILGLGAIAALIAYFKIPKFDK